jgi:hypothetical protein
VARAQNSCVALYECDIFKLSRRVKRFFEPNANLKIAERIYAQGAKGDAGLSPLCLALIASATPALAQQAPAIHVGSDTRAKPEAQCLSDAQFAITETGLAVSFTTGINVGGAGSLRGAGVAVLVTCLPQGSRTFIEVVGTSLDSGAAEETRNRVRTITMGPAS